MVIWIWLWPTGGLLALAAGPDKQLDAGVPEFWAPYAQCDQLLLNDGSGQFRDASRSNAALCGRAAVSRGLACADLNNDGYLDLIVTSIAGRVKVLQNMGKQAKNGHWLQIRAVDPNLRRDAYGRRNFRNSCGTAAATLDQSRV